MASIKAIAAIALTLMIAVPIGLGYAFASTEESTTSWQTTSTSNATELLYNYYSDYFMSYNDPMNNRSLVSNGSAFPDYNTVSTTTSSLPYATMTSGSGSYTYDADVAGTTYSSGTVGTSGSGATNIITGDAGHSAAASSGSDVYIYLTYSSGSTETIYGSYTIQYARESSSTYVINIYNTDGEVSRTYYDVAEWSTTFRAYWYTCDYAALSYSDTVWDFTATGATSFRLSDGSTTTIVGCGAGDELSIDNGTAYVNKIEVATGVTSMGIAESLSPGSAPSNGTTYTVTLNIPSYSSTSYVTAADGWSLPSGSDGVYWRNFHENTEVRLMISLGAGETCTLGPSLLAYTGWGYTVTDFVQISRDSSGNITVTDTDASASTLLGAYQYVMVVVGEDSATVYGLSSWPSMGVYPTTYNQVTVDYEDLGDVFRYIYLDDDRDGNVSYRVDTAEIVAGTFPATKDLTLDLSEKYPEQSLVLTLKSIAVYGDTVAFGGESFTVTDGKISGTDASGDAFTVTLRGAVVRYVYSDGAYTVTVGGHELAGTAGTVYFGGEWSLTSSISLISETTTTQQVWAPGEFAFDKEDFAACGLLVAGACLIGLGMTGSRSGVKMGVLLMICGGAGLIYLTLI